MDYTLIRGNRSFHVPDLDKQFEGLYVTYNDTSRG
jgi:hypothetical protein